LKKRSYLIGYYILQGHDPIPLKDDQTLQWARWFETAERHVAQDTVGDFWVSTIFLGLDQNYALVGEPILFETMIFYEPARQLRKKLRQQMRNWGELAAALQESRKEAPALDQSQWRYSTWEEAEEGHRAVVEAIKDLDKLKSGGVKQ